MITRRLPGFLVTVLGHRTASRTNRHTHARAYFSLLAAGSYWEHDTSGRFEYAPGYIRFHPPGAEHDDEVGASGARFLCVEVTETVLAALPPRFRDEPRFAGPHTELSRIAGALLRETSAGEDSTGLVLEGLALQLTGALARLRVENDMPPWLYRVAERLRDESHLQLRLADLAAGAGVHPVYLARAFRRHFGSSVGERLRQLRVEAVCAALAQPGTSIADAAAAAGFTDQSHCSRVFRRCLGTTPARYRDRVAPIRSRKAYDNEGIAR